MPRDLPPTSSLRAFSLAAHRLSFKRAADELGLSPSALSRQIQALEEHLGVALFRRLNPGLELTDEGRRYLTTVDAALDLLATGERQLVARPRELRVSALQSFIESWLVPHLPEFERRHPDIELRIEATLRSSRDELSEGEQEAASAASNSMTVGAEHRDYFARIIAAWFK